MISISKIKVPLLFPGFLVYVVKFGRVLMTCEKHLYYYVIQCNCVTRGPCSEKKSLAASLSNFSNPSKNYITEISLLYVLQGVETYLEA